jgi:hypothetical protein
VRFPAKAWSKVPAATPRKACLEMKGVPWRQPASDDPSWQPVDFKHEGGVWFAKDTFVEMANGAQPRHPFRQARTASALAPAACLIRWLGPGASRRTPLGAGIAPISGAALVLQLVALSTCHSPGRLEFRKSRWRGHLRGRALKDS